MEVWGVKEMQLQPASICAGLCRRGATPTRSFMRRAILPQRSFANIAAFLQPPTWRLLSARAAGARRLQATKWFIAGGLQVASGGGSSPEGGVRALRPCSSATMPGGRRRLVATTPKDSIAFSCVLLGCFSQKCRPYPQIIGSFGRVFVWGCM
jgi:hypothetical protein